MIRRDFAAAVNIVWCVCLWGAVGIAQAADVIDASLARVDDEKKLAWYDLQLLDIEGRAFSETTSPYDRLPANAEGVVRDAVWKLSRHSAGLCARFVTNATSIQAKWTLTSTRLAMPHMAATGVSGLDLYVKTERGQWRWLATGSPTEQENSKVLVRSVPVGKREYMLYLPLYNGVSEVEIGIPSDATLAKAQSHVHKPIVFYGTSITHGACASRPGMVHTAILGRRLGYPVVNLGFSGNGRMEAEVAKLMSEIDASVYVIDCLPNIRAEEVTQRTEPLVRILRDAHPETPILLVEDRSYADSFLIESKRLRNEQSRAALRAVLERLNDAGEKNVYYLEGEHLLGSDGEGTVDSSHPTDLGFLRQADAFEEVLRPVLGLSNK